MIQKKRKKTKRTYRQRIASRKIYLTKILKETDKYSPELAMQVDIAAKLYVKVEQLEEAMNSESYAPIMQWESREGAVRLDVNPMEELYSDYLSRYQAALRALGMNTDSKERKSEGGDGLKDFMNQLKEEDGR